MSIEGQAAFFSLPYYEKTTYEQVDWDPDLGMHALMGTILIVDKYTTTSGYGRNIAEQFIWDNQLLSILSNTGQLGFSLNSGETDLVLESATLYGELSFNATSVPLPGSITLLAGGLMGLLGISRTHRRHFRKTFGNGSGEERD